jgi:nitroreductase
MPVLGIDHDLNDKIDVIIEARRTVRSFEADAPEPELIKEVIKAGLLAPYARVAVDDYKYFRRFFVIEKDTDAMSKAEEMIRNRAKDGYALLSRQAQEDHEFAKQAGSFLNRMKSISEGGEIGFESAPYFVVVAEKKGFPPVELQSLAHCLENMWLKCVPLGLAFRLISATSQMADDGAFCAFLDIPKGEFGLNGCAIGYPKETPPATKRPLLEEVIKWMDRR